MKKIHNICTSVEANVIRSTDLLSPNRSQDMLDVSTFEFLIFVVVVVVLVLVLEFSL